ncbi:acetate/propionate family kinase [Tomitella biformata]|uniref:acetate/propionate family kinase n=1 Tax=Tomitella biformata TaxID=630403 RepID=UPI0004642776|nr:acetate kinase [Tomitella biformata]
MSKLVLVVNSGSSSIKYQLLDPNAEAVVASGLVEQIGEVEGHIEHKYRGVKSEFQGPIPDHEAGLHLAYRMFADTGLALEDAGIAAIGHRIVHGGEVFYDPTLITPEVIAEIERLADLAPLHNPPNVIGIRVAQARFPDLPHVGVFDTGFFHTMSKAAVTYAIDTEVAEKYGVRRYGFHGTSHQYVSEQVAKVLDRPLADVNTIVLHLGNGASASAVRGGVAVETSMGLTPLEGLVMGTRPGDIDPGALLHLGRAAGMDVPQLDELLNQRSGLKGLSGGNDFRELTLKVAAGDERAKLAYDVYTHRLRKYVGAYLAVLGRVDAIAFTAGVGENAASIRADSLSGLEPLGIEIDIAANDQRSSEARIISTPGSRTKVLVVPTNEELAIAKAAWKFV